ncbi:heme anaerobic degradation radical SAM methyltransferase ChuW/HutW|uniref:Oxygen-independent coproporphyrinogen-3 oxidase n=1 Tax=Dendrosporobacter quercicolus TaxID=146817 RepID=A0A1G9T164_9FIRM|nr:heme anaerobic degradation radical SAM methyltransferase ChuW/HutW [Dendrosporobacter quercicolus]NSL48567.1 heme anaerobic degradation radical SAM methyltransferase ChuW/HutW [Dendrosporobacter quercicolus DSM 1736]SDM40825.1 oxygen-independent coproporphyrinogen-3 oxidase [Dendrosporobacter quercicolus]
MRGSKLKQILANMSAEQYALTVGTAAGEPLTEAFSRKRVVHAGVRGKPVMPAEWQSTWQRLVGERPKPAERAAYLHIPFCRHRCLYCGFFQNYSEDELENAYINSLIKELEMSKDSPYLAGGPVNAVFIGGGTPSTLSPQNAARLLSAVRNCLPLANDYELTLEGRIHDLTADKIEAWLANGVNRVSIGVQSFDTDVRRAVGRLDDTRTILERLERLSGYNQAAVIIDLIYGLPNQTGEIWNEDLALLKTAAIDGMDLYQLNIFQDSALQQAIHAGKLPPAATTAEQAGMFAVAEAELSAQVFSRLSICHWAKTNRERSMYNVLTKAGRNVIPFGAGAGGNLDGVTMFLNRDVGKYMESVAAGCKPVAGMFVQPAGSELHNTVVAQLERGYLNLSLLSARFGPAVLELDPLLELWQARGLLQSGPVTAKLTVSGQFWYMNIAQSVLECLHALLDGEHAVEVQPIAAQG